MIQVITDPEHSRLPEAYALRKKILHGRFGWPLDDDELDSIATHILYPPSDRLKGYLRLLPTTGPTMLDRCFNSFFKERLTAPSIWEVSKFCLENPADLLNKQLIASLDRFCQSSGIHSLTGIINRETLDFYDYAGIKVEALERATINGDLCYNIIRHVNGDLT